MTKGPTTTSIARRAWKPIGAAIAISTALHLGFVLLFQTGAIPTAPAPKRPPLVTFLSPTADAVSIRDFRERIELEDPSISSLPHPRGFSRTALTRFRPVPSRMDARLPNPQFLERRPQDLSRLSLVREPSLPGLLEEYGARLPAATVEVESEVTTAVFRRPQSTYELSPELNERKLLTLASLPAVGSPAPAMPTTLRVAVAPVGDVKFAIVERGSGSEDKDARALDIVRRWRFRAVAESAGDQWGTVWIYWATEPPAQPDREQAP
jgi:TonB family protein